MDRKQVLIIDGYNAIRNSARYSSLGNDFDHSSWNKAREALINDAAMFAQGDYEKCYVIFDGAGNPQSNGKVQHVAGVKVKFSPSGVSADTVIEKLSHDMREKGFEVVVVSSDYSIQSTVFGGGVTRMSSSVFSSVGQEMEDEWRENRIKPKTRNTIADRVDSATLAKLESLRNSK